MATGNIAYITVTGFVVAGTPAVTYSAMVLAPDGSVVQGIDHVPVLNGEPAHFSYGASGEDIRQAVIADVQSRYQDSSLRVSFVTG